MTRLILTNFKKSLTDVTFYICILLVFALCFTATVIYDSVTGDPISVLDVIIRNDSKFVLENIQLNAYEIFRMGGTGNWLVMFLPIIVSFSFVKRFCDGRDSRFIRFEIFRLSKLKYSLGTVFSAMLLSGLSVMTGYILYGIYTAAVFPDLSYYPDMSEIYLEGIEASITPPFDMLYSAIGMPALYIARTLGMFLYGAVSALPAVLAASLMRNQYLIICLPFFASYLVSILCQRLWGAAFADPENTRQWMYAVATAIHPAALEDIFANGFYAAEKAVYYGVLAAGATALFIIAMNRRTDKGE